MPSKREEFEPWLNEYLRKRHPELEDALMTAVDAFDSIIANDRIDDELLTRIVDAASSDRVPLYSNATDLLRELAPDWQEVRDAILRMANVSRRHVRVNAIHCLGKSTPRDFVLGLLRHSLHDKSSNVREAASVTAVRLRLTELVPDLAHAVGRESSSEVKERMERDLVLLRDGYIIRPEEKSGWWYVTTRCHNGIISRTVSQAELDKTGIDAIVTELARSP
jgi:hypothetical protein